MMTTWKFKRQALDLQPNKPTRSYYSLPYLARTASICFSNDILFFFVAKTRVSHNLSSCKKIFTHTSSQPDS